MSWGAVAAAGINVLGGILGRNSARREARRAEKLNDPVYRRQRFEAAGIHPRLGLGSNWGGAVQAQTGFLGNAIANGVSAAIDVSQRERELEIQRTRLEQDNERLNKLVERHTLRPSIPGVYGNGNVREGVSGGVRRDSSASDSGAAGVRGAVLLGSGVTVGDGTVTSAQDLGSNTYVNPRILDAEVSEARYAEIGSEIAGIRNIFKDNAYNDRLQLVRQKYGSAVASEVNDAFAKADGRSLETVIRNVTKGKKPLVRPKMRPGSVIRIAPPTIHPRSTRRLAY